MMLRISRKEARKLSLLKVLDLEQCEFCNRLNILNLGWRAFGKFNCSFHQKEHVLCWELCYKVARKLLVCELHQATQEIEIKEPVKPNKKYDLASCYLCSKELKGASKKGVIKNRNNPGFWGLALAYKVICLACLGKRYYRKMESWQQKKWREYKRRGYE